MNDLPRNLKWLTRGVRGSAMVGIVVGVLGPPILWSHRDAVLFLAALMSNLPADRIVIDTRAQWLGFLVSLPNTGVWIYGLWQLWRLFGHYAAGQIFAIGTQKHLKRFAWALLAATLIDPVETSCTSVIFSLGMPPGQRMLTFRLEGSSFLLPLLMSALLLAIAEVLSSASRIADHSRELEITNAAKTRFLAAASHDLRQPVVSISLLTELLREQPLPPGASLILARIGSSVQALNELLKGLLDLSRFDAGAVQVHRSRVALRPMLARIIGDEAEAARAKGLTLRLRTAGFEVQSDAILLEQILRNLVGNAVRYTRRGGVLLTARRRGADRLLLQVWDTGPGIAPPSQARVFEEFVQLEPQAGGRSGGLGLGLSLVRRASEALDAPLSLHSVVARGTCFTLELPLVGFEAPPCETATTRKPGLDGRHVWIVEDDASVREALRLRLTGWGASVRPFAGVSAVRQALADPARVLPDLLISDQHLADGTGLEVGQFLRHAAPALPVLMVTGSTSSADIALLAASGLPVLHKPFSSESLLAAVHALGIDDLRPA